MIGLRGFKTAVLLAISVALATESGFAGGVFGPHVLRDRPVIVGAGPIGLSLALKLKGRGLDPVILEKRPKLAGEVDSSRSFSITLSEEALRLLPEEARERVRAEVYPLLGRAIHSPNGEVSFMRFASSRRNFFNTISRERLTGILHDTAQAAGIEIHSGIEMTQADPKRGQFQFKKTGQGDAKPEVLETPVDTLIGTDGSDSVLRPAIAQALGTRESTQELSYVFYTFRIPARPDGGSALEREWFHFWLRKNATAYAVPDSEGNLNGILAIQKHSLPTSEDGFRHLLNSQFSDLLGAVPHLPEKLTNTPPRKIRMVSASAWSYEDAYAILGDAAHAMGFFGGLGTESGLEDVDAIDQRLAKLAPANWRESLRKIERERRSASIYHQASSEIPWEPGLLPDLHKKTDFTAQAERALALRVPDRFVPTAKLGSQVGLSFSDFRTRSSLQDDFIQRLGKRSNWDASRVDWDLAATEALAALSPL